MGNCSCSYVFYLFTAVRLPFHFIQLIYVCWCWSYAFTSSAVLPVWWLSRCCQGEVRHHHWLSSRCNWWNGMNLLSIADNYILSNVQLYTHVYLTQTDRNSFVLYPNIISISAFLSSRKSHADRSRRVHDLLREWIVTDVCSNFRTHYHRHQQWYAVLLSCPDVLGKQQVVNRPVCSHRSNSAWPRASWTSSHSTPGSRRLLYCSVQSKSVNCLYVRMSRQQEKNILCIRTTWLDTPLSQWIWSTEYIFTLTYFISVTWTS